MIQSNDMPLLGISVSYHYGTFTLLAACHNTQGTILPVESATYHDRLTLENCAMQCVQLKLNVSGTVLVYYDRHLHSVMGSQPRRLLGER
jgi:hypothetical protein